MGSNVRWSLNWLGEVRQQVTKGGGLQVVLYTRVHGPNFERWGGVACARLNADGLYCGMWALPLYSSGADEVVTRSRTMTAKPQANTNTSEPSPAITRWISRDNYGVSGLYLERHIKAEDNRFGRAKRERSKCTNHGGGGTEVKARGNVERGFTRGKTGVL